MPSFEVEFEVYCTCGAGLCNQSNGSNKRMPRVEVAVCEDCAAARYNDGYAEGYDAARKEFEHGCK